MNRSHQDKIVVLGFLSHFPVAGVAWQTIHYLVGFQRLGFDVYYVEAHGCTPSKLMQSEADDGALRAAEYIDRILGRFDLQGRWAYHAIYESRCLGMSLAQVNDLYRSAALIINLHGSHLPTPELTATNRLVYLGTDPVDIEFDLCQKKTETIDYLRPHCAFFTYGENLGRPGCLVPAPEQFRFLPTRQPVVLEFWENRGGENAAVFTTVGNWRQPWRQVQYKGEIYRWSKHLEFRKFIDLPQLVRQPFELALSSYEEADQRLLESKGWHVRPALEISQGLDEYRRYISESRGEFTVAKDQNVRLHSGWFSDRAITYLAAGRPVITQETGFSNILPTGDGLFAFSTMDEIVAAVEAINADYGRHRRAASAVARECFSYEVVLGRLLGDLGISRTTVRSLRPRASRTHPGIGEANPAGAGSQESGLDASSPVRMSGLLAPSTLPSSLVITPISRWPTRLPEATLHAALSLPTPVANARGFVPQPQAETSMSSPQPASIVIVTCNGLPYTKMCLSSLLLNNWQPGDELIIVDNGSVDGTAEYLCDLARLNPFVRAVFNKRNRGYAAANNQGLALATGDTLILLNNDTIVPRGWQAGLARWLLDPAVGLAGPVTNRTCNEAQIDVTYRTWGEMEQFAQAYTANHWRKGADLRMLAMFCLAMRRDLLERIGPLDEQFEVGMFEDDDYARRVRKAGYRILCAEDVFVHHFGQASFGELCVTGAYDRVLDANRRRFEAKWGITWQPHGRRITPDYQNLRRRIRENALTHLPPGATVIVVSKGDDEVLRLDGRKGWHFPQAGDGQYANRYPAHSAEAIAQLEALRAKGGSFLLIPKPAFWWLEYYSRFKDHLEHHYQLAMRDDDTCLIFDLRGAHG